MTEINLSHPKWFDIILSSDKLILASNSRLNYHFYGMLYKYLFGWGFGMRRY